jgi:hypothetical protein
VLVATIVNLLVVAMASYRGAAYMDSPQFCGQLLPRDAARVHGLQNLRALSCGCVECHIGSGAQAYFSAKVNGTKQLIEVSLHPLAPLAPKVIPDYPTPIPRRSPACARRATPARAATRRRASTAKSCWSSRALPTTKRTPRRRRCWFCTWAAGFALALTGIHGVHLGHIEYIATDPTRTTIPWVQSGTRWLGDGLAASARATGVPQGERRVMDCIDCHNRAAHTFVTAEEASTAPWPRA